LRRARAEVLLADELEDVGDRLHRAERADAVGAVAALEAPEQLALGQQGDRDEVEDDEEDHQRLDDLHPPRLVVGDVGEDHAGSTSTVGPTSALALSPPSIASSRKTAPGGTAARSVT